MNKKSLWLFSITIILNLLVVRIPFAQLFPDPDSLSGQLFQRLMHGAIVLISGIALIHYTGLRTEAGLQLNRILRYRPLWPLTLIVLCWLYFSQSDFQKANVSSTLMLFIILTALLKASAEEIIFRGLFQAWLLREKVRPRRAILFTSLLFSFMHLSNLFVFGDWVSLINQLVFAFFIGLLFGVLTFATGNILFSCILHTLMNLPFYMQQFAIKHSESNVPDLPVPGLGEGIFSILMFCVIFSPFFGLAVYYLLNRNWVPSTVSRG